MTDPGPCAGGGSTRRQIVSVVLALAMLLMALAPRAMAPIPRPTYTAGDFWSYRTNVTEEIGFRFDGNTTIDVRTPRVILVQGQQVEALEVLFSGGGAFGGTFEGFGAIDGTWTIIGAEDWETDTWKSVRSFVRLTATGRAGGTPALTFTLTVENETTRRIVSDDWRFPIVEESTGTTVWHWNVTQNVTYRVQGRPPETNTSWLDSTFTTQYVYERTETVQVLAGAFEAHVIREEGPEGERVRWYAPRVGNDVKQEEFNETGAKVATSELTDFEYAAGTPPPPFPWLFVVVVAIGIVVAVLAAVLLRRPRKPVEVWMPPERATPPPLSP